MSKGVLRSWAGLTLGLVVMALAVAGLHRMSGPRGGLGDNVVGQSRARGLEADAYFYTEVGDVRAFLDAEGRYGMALTGRSSAR